jgi:hypothetical protein
MNRKNAFTAAVVLPRKMGLKMVSNVINAMHVANNLREDLRFQNNNYGKSIAKGNRPIHNYQKDTTILYELFSASWTIFSLV